MQTVHAHHFLEPYNMTSDNHDVVLERAGMTQEQLAKAVSQAEIFHRHFEETFATAPRGDHLPALAPNPAEQKFIRRSGGVPEAVVAKIGSNSIAKRKPAGEQRDLFVRHVREKLEAEQPLLFRIVTGPVKNVRHYGANQTPDLAEYLMLTQLAHVVMAVAALYPHGVKVEMVPDDKRGGDANLWPAEYGKRYIAGMQDLTNRMGFGNWLKIEDGQERLYKRFNVSAFYAAAEEHLHRWAKADPQAFAVRLEAAVRKAGDNLVIACSTRQVTKTEATDSAWRYMVALKAEELSGLFAPGEAFPLIYGNHPNNFQIYTMGEGQTKLPWQIALPPSLIAGEAKILPLRPGLNNAASYGAQPAARSAADLLKGPKVI